MTDSKWIEWARGLQAISQIGLHYSEIPYDRERYEKIAEIAAEIMAEHSNLPPQRILELNGTEYGYATPKVDVRGVVFDGPNVLLVRELMDEGRWTVPGGWADVNDTPSEAVIREVYEESGYDTRIVKLLAVYDREKQGHLPPMPFHVYKIFFLCEITGGAPKESHETAEAKFFPVDNLPELSISRITEAQLRRFHQTLQDPAAPADFD